ncbi:MAG: hypothetical protein K6F77_03030 [Lachnospiraceae bacterium]|nr:hypothetical protein [Lachnospiraceae bacterium]
MKLFKKYISVVIVISLVMQVLCVKSVKAEDNNIALLYYHNSLVGIHDVVGQSGGTDAVIEGDGRYTVFLDLEGIVSSLPEALGVRIPNYTNLVGGVGVTPYNNDIIDEKAFYNATGVNIYDLIVNIDGTDVYAPQDDEIIYGTINNETDLFIEIFDVNHNGEVIRSTVFDGVTKYRYISITFSLSIDVDVAAENNAYYISGNKSYQHVKKTIEDIQNITDEANKISLTESTEYATKKAYEETQEKLSDVQSLVKSAQEYSDSILLLANNSEIQEKKEEPVGKKVLENLLALREDAQNMIYLAQNNVETINDICKKALERYESITKNSSKSATESAVNMEKSNQTIDIKKSFKFEYGKKYKLQPTSNAGDETKFSYSSSASSIVKVDSDANLVAKGYGSTEVTVHASETLKYKENSTKVKVKVVPQKVKIKKCKIKSGILRLKFSKAKNITEYEIKIKNGKKNTTLKTKKNSINGTVNKGIKYKIKVRAYKKEGKKTYYGNWSKKKVVKA